MKRNKFSLSHYKLLSMNQGHLVPVGLTEVLPGDTIQQNTSALIRTQPLAAPVMHPVDARIHHWYVPHRLVWDEWEDFITGGPDGMDDTEFPTITTPASTGFAVSSLADYLGVLPAVPSRPVSALPFRGYALIWNEWYRDQDLETELVVSKASGSDTTTSVALQNCAWEKDYFTTARPWEQKGPSITIPIGDSADIKGIGWSTTPGLASQTFRETGGTTQTGVSAQITSSGAAAGNQLFVAQRGSTGFPDITADLSNASAITVNALREALALQRFEEARARFGSRYVEYLRYLGVKSSDARLQRPEYLGGGRQKIQFSEVLQTAEGTDAVGTLKGHGIGAMRSNRYRRFIEEHGYIYTFLSVKPKTMYAQGLARHWNRRIKEDFWQKELEHIGQQEVLNKEVYFPHTTPDGVFGYTDRYDEYRKTESSVAGNFRDTLDFWHMARIFSSDPALNAAFVKSNPTNRVYAVPAEDQLYVMANHSIQARRLVTGTGTSFIF